MNNCPKEGNCSESPSLRIPKGVAVVTPSRGVTQVVIATGQEATRNALPIKAGLKILQPKPPKNCLPIMIATAEPIAAIHKGIVDGRQKASNKPVITALPSLIVTSRCIIFWAITSLSRAVITQVRITVAAAMPKKYTAPTKAGKRAMQTSRIAVETLLALCKCGEDDTINKFSCVFIISYPHHSWL
jgi:hypothetical protein